MDIGKSIRFIFYVLRLKGRIMGARGKLGKLRLPIQKESVIPAAKRMAPSGDKKPAKVKVPKK
jgi:hypothetical protein